MIMILIASIGKEHWGSNCWSWSEKTEDSKVYQTSVHPASHQDDDDDDDNLWHSNDDFDDDDDDDSQDSNDEFDDDVCDVWKPGYGVGERLQHRERLSREWFWEFEYKG